MICKIVDRWFRAITLFVCLFAVSIAQTELNAQQAGGSIHGTVSDPSGRAIAGASVTLEDADGSPVQRALTDAQGAYSIGTVKAGHYNLAVSATGFATEGQSIVFSGSEQTVEFKLPLASVAEEVVVESEDNSSLAVQLAPVKALLDAGSARTEISSFYISQYTSPVTDFADIIQAAPGTVSYTTNGIGNGQAKIFYRGFVDDDYTMTWDGVPFDDSNDPSHHSWAYIPAAAVGYVDFDRSPGTASDIGPSNFGGSIHFFSPKLSDEPHFRIQETYGSWNTNQILGDINSGDFLKGKGHFWLNSDYQSSDGYQTFSPKQNVSGTAKLDYKFTDRTDLTVTASHIMLDAFTNNDPTRRQLFHHGDNYLYDNNMLNADGTYNAQFWRYSVYHVPSFFDVVTYNHDFGKGWKLDAKPYTYGYSNHQHYQT
ncbi:MAG: TonB-dependent receptor, partial [Terracidiphilus sp.]